MSKFSKWFPSPCGILLEAIDDKKEQLRFKHESSDEEFSAEESSDEEFSADESSDEEFSADEESSSDESLPLIENLTEIDESDDGKLKGTNLDVVPFLSNNGKTTHLVRNNDQTVKIEVVRGKYLLICCVNLPVKCYSNDYDICRSLIDSYPKLHGNLFEIVLVANMKPSFNLRKDVFDAFFSAFQCLAVPFSEFDTRNSISSFIGLNPGRDIIETVLVDPTGCILQHRKASDYFLTFGSEWYPFTDDFVELLETQDDILRMRLDPFYQKRESVSPKAEAIVDSYNQQPPPLSLHADILLCDCCLVLHRVDPDAGPSMTVSQLSEKYIGLYLCYDGEYIHTLNKVHKECVALNQELEVLIIGLPLDDDPISYHKNLLELLKLNEITSWFLFPLEENRMVYRRLSRVFGSEEEDRLIILPPYNSGQPGEIEARALIAQFGRNTYPFTATKVVEQRYNALKSLNPILWFRDSRKKKRTCLIRNDSNSYVRKSTLVDKKLLLYLDSLRLPDDGEFCYLLMKNYDEIKASGCEVVFVPLDEEDVYLHEQNDAIPEMPWPIMPVQAAVDASVIKQLLPRGHDDRSNRLLIAFDEDGKILSKQASCKLKEEGVTESLFADTLYQELVDDLIHLQPHEYE
ncbi:putative nucleoredoxin 1-2 [Silene latifolia]|uniref:putative nucleoredoxin 1-2 n=1 Tax=Silene latifolia TaxID=37657 RepID=UPI003D781998